ncbi:type II toxin-antitoxin system RelE/ParE family toxin [Sphingobium yanoikuyae]
MPMSKAPTHTLIETPAFTARVKKMGVSETELAAIYDEYAADPSHGKVIKRTGGLRKGRIAKDDKGKSGGYRVFSFYADDANPTFLLWIIDKSEDSTLTDAQENAFKAITAQIKEALK